MAKSDKNSRGRGNEGGEEKKGGRSAYKAKRSFTRNKGFREKEKDAPRRKGSARESGDRAWGDKKRSFDKPAYRDRPVKRSDKGREESSSRPGEDRERGIDRERERKRPWSDERPGGAREKRQSRRDEDRPVRSHEERARGESADRSSKRSGEREGDRAGRERKGYGKRSRHDEERPVTSHEERESRDEADRSEGKSRDRESSQRGKKNSEGGEKRRYSKRNFENEAGGRGNELNSRFGDDAAERPRFSERERPSRGETGRKGRKGPEGRSEGYSPRRVKHDEFEEGRSFEKQAAGTKKKPGHANRNPANEGLIRLNKYLANAGLASRREADTLIQSGAVKVNGVVIDQLGYKIKPGDKVTYGDESVKGERKVYLLLNKPKDYITTVEDPRDRKTVMELIKGACRERVYPVGRLDRNTTGLLLFTNDGELTTKLTNPKYGVKKVYHVTLDKNLKTTDFQALVDGVELEDGVAKADDLAFVGEGKREVGIEIHSGRNRIVRRMFEHLGYSVIKLDRVVFAGLTKKDLPRGKHRFLTAKEIAFLQMIG